MPVKDFLKLFGGEDEKVAFYECDERETIVLPVREVLNDSRWEPLLKGEFASWDYDDTDGENILCIYYFKDETL